MASFKHRLRIDPESGAVMVRSRQQRTVLLAIDRYNREKMTATVRRIELSEPIDEHSIRSVIWLLQRNGLVNPADGRGNSYTLTAEGRKAVRWVIDHPEEATTQHPNRTPQGRHDPHRWDGETDSLTATVARMVLALDAGRDDEAGDMLRAELGRLGLDDVERAKGFSRGDIE